MNSVERVKQICKERGLPISKLEKACGFSNGYVSQLRKGTFPDDRLYKIAAYLKVDPQFLLTGKTAKETFTETYETEKQKEDGDAIAVRDRLRSSPELKILFDAAENAPASALLEAAAIIMRYKEQSK